MVVGVVLARIKVALACFLSLIRRSLCCFRRRRKSSADSVPLTTIGIVPNYQDGGSHPNQDVNWGTWDETGKPQTIQDHIHLYRTKAAGGFKEDPEEPLPDFFQDMEPEIRKQTKVILKPRDISSNRLAFTADAVIPTGESELESWEESEKRRSEWAEAEEWDPEGMLREQRKEELKKKALEREHRRTLVSRLS